MKRAIQIGMIFCWIVILTGCAALETTSTVPVVASLPTTETTGVSTTTAAPLLELVISETLPRIDQYPPVAGYSEVRVLIMDAQGYFIQNIDGSNRSPIAPWGEVVSVSGSAEGSIRPSPAGDAILFLFNQAPLSQMSTPDQNSIWKTDANGQNRTMLVGASTDWFPSEGIWSPDGKKIAYLRQYPRSMEEVVIHPRPRTEIWVMDGDGTNHRLVAAGDDVEINLTNGLAAMFRWMDNGYIYFVNTQSKLHALNPDTGELFLLMSGIDEWEAAGSILDDGVSALGRSDEFSRGNGSGVFKILDVPMNSFVASSQIPQFVIQMLPAGSGNSSLLIEDIIRNRQKRVELESTGKIQSFSPEGMYMVYKGLGGLHFVETGMDTINREWLYPDPATQGNRTVYFIAWVPIL